MEPDAVYLEEVRLLRLILDLLSMCSEKNVVCELHVTVVVEAHVSHANSSIDRTSSQPVRVWFQRNAHDWTLQVASAVCNFLVLHELFHLYHSDLGIAAANHQVWHSEIHHKWNKLEFYTHHWLWVPKVPKDKILVLPYSQDKELVLDGDELHRCDP